MYGVRMLYCCLNRTFCGMCSVYSGINGWKSFAHVFSPFCGTTISDFCFSFLLFLHTLSFSFYFHASSFNLHRSKSKRRSFSKVSNRSNSSIYSVAMRRNQAHYNYTRNSNGNYDSFQSVRMCHAWLEFRRNRMPLTD